MGNKFAGLCLFCSWVLGGFLAATKTGMKCLSSQMEASSAGVRASVRTDGKKDREEWACNLACSGIGSRFHKPSCYLVIKVVYVVYMIATASVSMFVPHNQICCDCPKLPLANQTRVYSSLPTSIRYLRMKLPTTHCPKPYPSDLRTKFSFPLLPFAQHTGRGRSGSASLSKSPVVIGDSTHRRNCSLYFFSIFQWRYCINIFYLIPL
jgi:hypothetical protein